MGRNGTRREMLRKEAEDRAGDVLGKWSWCADINISLRMHTFPRSARLQSLSLILIRRIIHHLEIARKLAGTTS